MSFLLTPVALICPLFCNSAQDVQEEQLQLSSVISQPHQQAVCRILQGSQGETTVNIGTSGIEIYPIHYIDDENTHIIFAAKLLGDYIPQQTHIWTGDIHTQRVSSSEEKVSFVHNELRLVSLSLNHPVDWQKDHLCISFATEHGTREMAQIQLQRE